MKQPKKAISLFAGIEGFGLAIHKMGWEVVASVEWEQFPQLVIKKNFPKTEIHGDIKEFDGTKFRGTIDIVCGGFPCQPYSLAGKRQGKDDDRHLWPQMLRVIREVQPTWVIGENVPGLVNWSKGVVFEEVQSDLEAEGYEVQSFILPAAGVGAPHRRDRVWIVAYSRLFGQEKRQQQTMGSEQLCKKRATSNTKGEQDDGDGSRGFFSKPPGTYEQRVTSNPTSNRRLWNRSGFAPEKRQQQGFIQAGQLAGRLEGLRFQGDATHPRSPGQQKQNISTEPTEQGFNPGVNNAPGAAWQNFPTQSPVCDGDDGISARLVRYILRTGGDCYTEEEAEKEAKKIISKVRAEGIKAGGNAIVHQVALQIFQAIEDFENQLQKPALRL